MKNLSNVISSYCVQNKIIDPNDEAWLQYGLEKRLSTAIIMFPFIVLAIILSDFTASIAFFIAFKLLREKASGYHANTLIGCVFISFFLELIFMAGLYPVLNCEISLFCNILSCTVLFTLAPYNHPNMSFSAKEIHALQRSSRKTFLLLILIITVCNSIGLSSVANGLTTGIAMAAFSLCLAYIIDWRKRHEN